MNRVGGGGGGRGEELCSLIYEKKLQNTEHLLEHFHNKIGC